MVLNPVVIGLIVRVDKHRDRERAWLDFDPRLAEHERAQGVTPQATDRELAEWLL